MINILLSGFTIIKPMNKNLFIFIMNFFLYAFVSVQINAQLISSSSNRNVFSFSYIRESIDMHIDRGIYIAGDNLFFKLYLNNSDTFSRQQISNYAYIVLRSANANIVKSLVKVENGNCFGTIALPDTLKSSVYQLVAFTNYMRNFEEESFFHKDLLIINRFDKVLTEFFPKDSVLLDSPIFNSGISRTEIKENSLIIELEKDSFSVREKIRIKIKSGNSLTTKAKANISVAVKEINPLIDPLTRKGLLQSANVFNTDQNLISKKLTLDLSPTHLPEKEGVYLIGKISHDNKPVKDECLYLATPDTAANLQYSFSDSLGNFKFLLNDYYLGKTLILKLKESDSEKANSVFYLEDKYDLINPFKPVLPEFSIDFRKFIFSCQDIVQIQKAFNSKKVIISPDTNMQSLLFPFVYRMPTNIVLPSRYIPLNDFKEIASNLLTGVKIIKNKKQNEIYMTNRISNTYFNYQPTIFLDGVPIDNVMQINRLSSFDIKKIEICNLLRFKGEINFTGIISVISNKNLINSIQFDRPFIKFKIAKYLDNAFYETPKYDVSEYQKNKPDFRQLLYWNPEVVINPNEATEIEFYASDYISDYLIEVSGFSEDGKPLIGYARIKIYR